MKKQLTVAIAAMLVLGTLSLDAQTTTAPATTTTKTKKAKTAAKPKKVEETEEQKAIRELQEKMAAQQTQIDELKQQNAAKDAALSAAQSTAATASSQAAAATAQAQSATAATQSQSDAVTGLKSTVTDLQNANVGLATTISDTKKDLNDKVDSPAAIHYKGVTITPVALARALGQLRHQYALQHDSAAQRESGPRERVELLRPAEPSGRAVHGRCGQVQTLRLL